MDVHAFGRSAPTPPILTPVVAGLLATSLTLASPAAFAAPDTDGPLRISLQEAVEIALARSYRIRLARLDLEEARKQDDASNSNLWPQIDGTAGYTRNLLVPNPFAGTGAGNLFDGFGAIGWLAYNESERQEGRAGIPLQDYLDMDRAGQVAAGFDPDSGSNPFFVGNQFNLGLSARQILYNGAAFSGLEGSERFLETVEAGVDVEALQVVAETTRAFYGALLAAEQTKILTKSVKRTSTTLSETKKKVAQGVLPQFSQLSEEVELANLETELLRAENRAAAALDALRTALGLPPVRALSLKGELVMSERITPPALKEALGHAGARRPDLKRARLSVDVMEIQEKVTWAEYLPIIEAVANFAYQGSVPDDRSFLVPDANSPFVYTRESNSFFADGYWNPSLSVGLLVTWNLFNGFRTSATLEQNQVQTSRARLQLAQLEDQMYIEVQQALRDLATAEQQVATQERNIARAELNYRHAEIRVREGVSTQLELREASQQLDQSRLSHRQAIHDYLVAKVSYDVAVGEPPITPEDKP